MNLYFNYFFQNEADQFTFYRIPKDLIKNPIFSGLSNDAKILYGLLLDRMSLSRSNNWCDKEGRVYIIYSIENITIDLNCSKNKAIKSMAELDTNKGIGLIERIRRGLGKPDIIYVKNFITNEKTYDDPNSFDLDDNTSDLNNQKFKKQTSGNKFIPESHKTNHKEFKIETSRSPQNQLLEVANRAPNNNNMNQIESNKNNPINHINWPDSEEKDRRWIEKIETTRALIKTNIDYNILISDYPIDKEKIDELVELMVEVCTSQNKIIYIGIDSIPQSLVKERFETYDYELMEYVLTCLKTNTSKIHNIKHYLLKTLINAPLTIENYYSSEVNHDMNS